jgi:CDP-diacylglycerol--glycerol-3-phosphate 3-phosphatidyltransferase
VIKSLPNILTGARLVMALFVFVAISVAVGGFPPISDNLTPEAQFSLQRWAVIAFFVAGITDFFDGWLARKLEATSLWGAILDPIGDKVLICGAVLGLMLLGLNATASLAGALILFREFTVSALREVAAAKGVSLPVTLLAKWKTTLQIVALGAELVVATWNGFGFPDDPDLIRVATLGAHGLLWLAAAVTVITGAQYWQAARHKLTGL